MWRFVLAFPAVTGIIQILFMLFYIRREPIRYSIQASDDDSALKEIERLYTLRDDDGRKLSTGDHT